MHTTQMHETKSQVPSTARKDAWWVEPLLIGLGFGAFIIYATWRAFENNYYEWGPYLSPFYSPKLAIDWAIFGFKVSPAILILWIPAGFRATCYYYRKAYYRAYFQDPPACAVGHWGGEKYCGENAFPLVMQNAHRYFFYLATVVLLVLWYDALHAFFHDGGVHVSMVGLIMLVNVILLSGYSFGCHACRHLVGGRLDCFSSCSRTKAQFKIWQAVTKFNEHHMAWAWLSLFSVAFTDLYIRQLSCGQLPELGLF